MHGSRRLQFLEIFCEFIYLIYLNLCFDKYYNYLKIVRCTERRVTSFSNVLVQGGFVVLPAIHIITKKLEKYDLLDQ